MNRREFFMIKISHEVPLQLMEKSREWNDYDYALVHHFKKYPAYYKFYKESLRLGRTVILDNSIFELGTAFDMTAFAKWVKKLKPTEYIVPDVLEDAQGTIDQFELWKKNHSTLDGIRIGVVQGKTYQELSDCYTYMRKNADKIAISFDYSFYLSIGLGKNKWQQYADGRHRFINMLWEDATWRDDIPHHLLGAAVPQEFKLYIPLWDDLNIVSLDTSNPIQQGLQGNKYVPKMNGLPTKDSLMVTDSFETKYSSGQLAVADHNVKKFREICGRGNETLGSIF